MPSLIEHHNAAATTLLNGVDPATPLYGVLSALCIHNLDVIMAKTTSSCSGYGPPSALLSYLVKSAVNILF
jgi:hypothetical protein